VLPSGGGGGAMGRPPPLGGGNVCGAGGVGLATTVANNGVINIDKASWRNQSTWSGTGIVNVLDGGTFQLTTNAIGNTTTINLNGNGWKNASCVEQGALHATGSSVNIGAKINVQSASTIKTAASSGIIYSGILSGSAPLTVSTLSATKPNGTTNFSNSTNTYNGTITVDCTSLAQNSGNSLQYAKIVLTNGGRIQSSSATQTIRSLESSDPNTSWQIGGSNTVTANAITSPDGTQNADFLVKTATNSSAAYAYQTISSTASWNP
jgi:hypothetical protein